jgi:predicted Zn finger-like uncharacterized protein
MRIRCERCKSEYEIDESQVRGGSLEVQCSVCAQVFFISKQDLSRSPSPSPAPEESTWLVETAHGTQQFVDLAALQQSILEGKLSPLDRLTRDRRNWQALGSMAELAPMFAAAPTSAASEQRGCEPQETAVTNETSRFVLEPKSHGLLKMSVGLAVAAGVAFAGIRWQQDRNLHFQSRQAVAAVPVRHSPAAASPAPDTDSADQTGPEVAPVPTASTASRHAVVEALPSAPPPAPKKEAPAPVAASSPPAHASEGYDKLVADADRALENGGNARARELFQKALNLRPSGFKAMTGLGFVALDRGQLPVAYDYFKRALNAKTSYPPALFGIAEVHRARGEKSLALHTYQRYLDMSPNGADAPAARRQVQNLQPGR